MFENLASSKTKLQVFFCLNTIQYFKFGTYIKHFYVVQIQKNTVCCTDSVTDPANHYKLSKIVSHNKNNYVSSCYRGVFPWKSNNSSKNHESQPTPTNVTWRLFGTKSQGNLSSKTLNSETTKNLTPASSVVNTPHHHKRQGSSASEKQFEDLVASSIALIQHDR